MYDIGHVKGMRDVQKGSQLETRGSQMRAKCELKDCKMEPKSNQREPTWTELPPYMDQGKTFVEPSSTRNDVNNIVKNDAEQVMTFHETSCAKATPTSNEQSPTFRARGKTLWNSIAVHLFRVCVIMKSLENYITEKRCQDGRKTIETYH